MKEYLQQRKARRQRILDERKNSEFAKKMQPVYQMMNRLSLLLHGVGAVLINFIIEAASRHSVVSAWEYLTISPWTFMYNVYIIFITFLLVYLVRRRVFTRIIISVLWLVIGGVNGYMLSVRVTPFNAQDLKVFGDVLTMIDKYFTGFQGALLIIGIIALIAWLVSMWRRGGQYAGKMHRLIALAVCVVAFGTVGKVTDKAIEYRLISNYFGNIAFAYQDYGLPYCFCASVFDTGIDQPNGYNEETINNITGDGALVEVTAETEERPNIILIQLESFFDAYEAEFFTTSKDPIPTFHYLMDNYTSGYFIVPSVGAGTANTEFEVLTGMNLRYFGPGEYPYKTIAKYQPMESVASSLKQLGYGAHALHNNGGNFYSRADVFNYMGFDSYTSKEFMHVLELTENGWATDDILTEHIMNSMDSTEQQDFVFCITVEGHGDYPEEPTIQDPEIEIFGIEDEGTKYAWEYYVNHLHETDKFIADLISALEDRGEPSVLILYGDHLPTMGLKNSDLKSRYLFNTNYVVWDNIGLEEKDRNLPTYQLMADVFETLGFHTGTVFNYHQTRRQTDDYLLDLELLQYDMLYGENYVYGGKENAITVDGNFQMGILDVRVTGIEQFGEDIYSIYGANMTANSKVYVNGEKQKTKFYNDTHIELREITLEHGDHVMVNQVGSSNRVFRTGREYIYSQSGLIPVLEYVTPVSVE